MLRLLENCFRGTLYLREPKRFPYTRVFAATFKTSAFAKPSPHSVEHTPCHCCGGVVYGDSKHAATFEDANIWPNQDAPFSTILRRGFATLPFSNGALDAQAYGINNLASFNTLFLKSPIDLKGPLQDGFKGQRYSTAAQVASLDPPPTDSLPSWESGPPAARSRSQSNSFYDVTVERYAAKPLSTLTLKKMLSFGESAGGEQLERKVIKSAQFVQSELPVRLAKRLLDLQLLPYIVVTNPHIKRVYDAYHRAFLLLKDFPEVTSMEQNQYLTALLTKLVDEHAPLLTSLAKGLKECTTRPLVGPSLSLDPFLDNMLRSRISRRVIAEQHICFQQRREGYIGVICTELSVAQILGAAIARTEQVCRDTYGTHPPFEVTGDADTVFSYIPAHLDYIFFEILKNASRAVVEHHSRIAGSRGTRLPLKSTAMPPIVAQVCKGTREVTIKISDQGGGIDEEVQPKVWKYGYTSVDPTVALGSSSASPMADFRTGGDSCNGSDGRARLRAARLSPVRSILWGQYRAYEHSGVRHRCLPSNTSAWKPVGIRGDIGSATSSLPACGGVEQNIFRSRQVV